MSNTKISLLSQIHDKEMSWNAKVVVSRIWHYRGGSDDGPIVHTDIVVLDQEGTHMYGQIPPGPAENLKDILEEGKVYLIKRFMCKQSKQTYRAVESPYMMQLLGLLPCFLSRVLKKTTHTALQPRVLFGYSSARPKHLLLSRCYWPNHCGHRHTCCPLSIRPNLRILGL